GMRFVLTRKLPNGRWWDLIWEMIMPLNVHLVYTEEPKTEQVRAVTYCVPVDDTHQLGASIRWVPAGQGKALTGREQLAPAGRKCRQGLIDFTVPVSNLALPTISKPSLGLH